MSGANSAARVLFYSLLAAYVAVTLAQKSFPTQDGPLHLYYADVFTHLLRGDGVYDEYFTIKHRLPPYALHTYLLGALNGLVPPLMVERVLVALYTVWFCLAFRYLVHSVDSDNDVLPLMAFPFVHNKTLFYGFLNFSFGVAGTLTLVGYWLRHYDHLTWRRSAVFFALLALLGLTHPVALFVALMLLGVHAILILLSRYRANRSMLCRPVLHVACAGVLSAAWVFAFTQKGGLVMLADPFRLGQLIAMSPLAAFRHVPYRILLALPAAVVTVLGIARFFKDYRTRVFSRDHTLAVTAAICVVLYAVAPFEINHGGFFHERFPIFAIAFVTAFAAGAPLRPGLKRGLTAGLALLAAVCLSWQAVIKHRIIENLAELYDAAPASARQKAVVIGSEPWMKWSGAPVNFDPYYWAGMYYMLRSHAVLLNSTWLETPISMLQPTEPNTCSFNDPHPMAKCLLGNPPMPRPDLVIAVNEQRGAPDPISTDAIARSLGLTRLPIRSRYLSLFGKP